MTRDPEGSRVGRSVGIKAVTEGAQNASDMLVTRHEAARAAGVSYHTILLWIRAGRLHPVREPAPAIPSIMRSEVLAAVEQTFPTESKNVWSAQNVPAGDSGDSAPL
jgi:hypothetical protein